MLFRSQHNPDAKAVQELIIFCHGQERILLPLPDTYEDAIELARTEFNMSGEISLETTDLLGADDPAVRVHPTSWGGIRTVLSSVTVKSAHLQGSASAFRPRASVPSSAAPSSSRRMSSQKRISVAGSTPLRLANGTTISAVPAVERQSISARKAPVGSSTSRPRSVYSYKEPGPSIVTRSSTPSTKPVSPLPEPSRIEEVEEDEEEFHFKSPTKKRSARPRIMSDYGLDAEEEPQANESQRTTHSDEEFDQLDDSERPPSAGPSKSLVRSTSKSATLSRSGSGSLVDLDGNSSSGSRVPKAERASSVRQLDAPPAEQIKVKTEKPESKATPQPSQPAQAQPKTDESFLIMIEYSDDPDSRSLFKTRGRHTVSKVLMQACRTFGLDEYYRSARLVLLEEEETENGEIVHQGRYVCDRHETMAEAGAVPNAKFVVEIVYENDEEEDE